jgi:hypothetical protein
MNAKLAVLASVLLLGCGQVPGLPLEPPRAVAFRSLGSDDASGCYQLDSDPDAPSTGLAPMSMPFPYAPPVRFRITDTTVGDHPGSPRIVRALSPDSTGARPTGSVVWSQHQMVISWLDHRMAVRKHADGILRASINGKEQLLRRIPCPDA